MKTQPLTRCCSELLILAACATFSAAAVPLESVPVVDPSIGPPASGGGDSLIPIISKDGRYVLFASTANNLALTSSNTPFASQVPPKLSVFLRDRTNGTTALASINIAGTGGGNADSKPVEISTNGQYALFESSASDLVPGDTNNATDVFVRDFVNATNLLVSVSTSGGCASGSSSESLMTPDGRYVAFTSTATNLVADDTNGLPDVFVRDLQSGTTVAASSGALKSLLPSPYNSSAVTNLGSPQMTPDGRYVAFLCGFRYNSVTFTEVFVRDLVAATTTLASSNAFTGGSSVSYSCYNHAISDDGEYVAFRASLSNTNVVKRYNLQTGFTDSVAVETGPIGGTTSDRNLLMTPDGRFIAFVTTTNSSSRVFLWDGQDGTTTLVSGNPSNAVQASSVCDWPAIDSSGRFVAFLSTATNLTTNVVAGPFHLYVRDLQAGVTKLVDVDANGTGPVNSLLAAPRLTPDGRSVAFDCTAGNLVPNDNNHACDVFVRDLTTDTTELISARHASLPSLTPNGFISGSTFSISTSGHYIAFASTADNLSPNSVGNFRSVFVTDLLSGTNFLVSVDTNGVAVTNGMSTDPVISADGRYVAFTSSATNLVTGDSNKTQDVFIRDLQSQTTSLVSVNLSGTGPLTGDSFSPTISADGRFVLFRNALATSFTENLYLRDRQSGTTYALKSNGVSSASMTPDGHFVAFAGPSANFYVWDSLAAAMIYTNITASVITNIAISPDGNRIVYSTSGEFRVTDRAARTNWLIGGALPGSRIGLGFSGDARLLVYSSRVVVAPIGPVVYLYDFQTRSYFLVSHRLNSPNLPNGPSDSPAISPNGRFVAYRSTATNIVAGVTNGFPNIYLYDRQTGDTVLLSVSASGTAAANSRSLSPVFSGDGTTIVFQSQSSDLIAQDFNQGNDLFTVKIAVSNPAPVFAGQIVFAPASGQSPTLTWPAAPGKTYQVQFKNDLTDADWQPLNGNVWVDGDLGYATDLAPDAVHRFYRIVAF